MEWISVEDRLPKNNEYIKVKSYDFWIGEGIFQDEKFVYSWIKGACFGEISHWKSLPDIKKNTEFGTY